MPVWVSAPVCCTYIESKRHSPISTVAGQMRRVGGLCLARLLRYSCSGRWNEAEAAYHRLLLSDPKSAEVLSNLIAMSIETHDLESATRFSMRLLDVSPRSTIALRGLASVALERQEYEHAVRYCGRIVEQAPDCVEAWRNLRFATGRVMSALQTPEPASTAGMK